MYAIIRAGGKQAKVSPGQVIDVERIKTEDESVTYTPLLVVDDDGNAVSDRETLSGASVTARIVGGTSGPKIDMFTYKSKGGNRRRAGHRQKYTTIEITSIDLPGAAAKSKKAKAPAEADAGEKE